MDDGVHALQTSNQKTAVTTHAKYEVDDRQSLRQLFILSPFAVNLTC